MKKFKYTDIHIEFLRVGYRLMHARDLTGAFNRCFNMRKTEVQIKSTLKNHHIKCGRDHSARLIDRRRLFSDEQIEFIRANYPGRSAAEMTRLFNAAFATSLTLQQIKTCVHNRGIISGRTGYFEKGHRPHNKGVIGWDSGGRSHRTRFKKGQRGNKWVPIGSKRITKDGITQKKITDTGNTPRDWKSVHSLLWEKHHGKIPKSHIVVFKNGDVKDIRIDNLECISRAENMRRNTIHNLPPALADVVRWRGVLNRHINKRTGRNEK